jgi:ubiquinone/menaquinone biosynthesis C-methylase UbiE
MFEKIKQNNIEKKRMIDTMEGLKEYYERVATISDYSKLSRRDLYKEQRRTELFIHLLKPHKDEKLLDVGCGDGLQLEAFNKYNPHLKLCGIDVSKKRIERASKRVKAFLINGFADELPFKSETFDKVICSEVLEHVPNPLLVLKEIYRVMKNEGKLIISVPYRQKITYDICVYCGKPTPTSGHINSFDEEKIASMLKMSGFEPLKISGAIGSASLITPFRKIPYQLWKYLDWIIRKIRKDDIFLIALAKKIKLK